MWSLGANLVPTGTVLVTPCTRGYSEKKKNALKLECMQDAFSVSWTV